MASDVTVNTAVNQQANTLGAATQLAEDFDQFLQLLTVQLQNQDPLDPTDTNELTNQIVAFTGVEQQINTNQKLDSLVSLQLSSTFSNALSYVGLDARYFSSEMYFDGEKPLDIQYSIQGDSVDTTVNIFDEEGTLVFSQGVSGDELLETFTWDGTTTAGQPVEKGTYTVRIDALDIENNSIQTSTVVNGTIHGLETQNGAIFALIGERAVSIGQIINVSDPNDGVTDDEPDTTPPDDSGSTGSV